MNFKWQIGHRKWFLNTNLFLIKMFLIAKFDCTTLLSMFFLFDELLVFSVYKVLIQARGCASVIDYLLYQPKKKDDIIAIELKADNLSCTWSMTCQLISVVYDIVCSAYPSTNIKTEHPNIGKLKTHINSEFQRMIYFHQKKQKNRNTKVFFTHEYTRQFCVLFTRHKIQAQNFCLVYSWVKSTLMSSENCKPIG